MVSVAFWTGWESNVSVSQIPWTAVTEVNLMAVEPCNATGTTDCPTYSSINTDVNAIQCCTNVPQLVSTIHANHKLALITIGGSGNLDWYYPCNSSDVSAFASNLVDYMQTNGFDGIDVDIEQDPTTGSPVFSTADLIACITDIYNDAKAVTTAAGKTPLVTADVDPTTNYDIGADELGHVDWFNMMGYDSTCADGCARVAQEIGFLETKSGIPASEITIGTDTESGDSPTTSCCYDDLTTTTSTLSTSGPITSIPVAALGAAIPAGNIVLATTQNPPTNYQVFATSGAPQGATSIPVTSQTPNYAYPSGSYIQSDYLGPWNCGDIANYAAQPSTGVKGVMVWTLQGDAASHNGQFACFSQIAPYVTR